MDEEGMKIKTTDIQTDGYSEPLGSLSDMSEENSILLRLWARRTAVRKNTSCEAKLQKVN